MHFKRRYRPDGTFGIEYDGDPAEPMRFTRDLATATNGGKTPKVGDLITFHCINGTLTYRVAKHHNELGLEYFELEFESETP